MIKNSVYSEQINDYVKNNKNILYKLDNKTILITGAAGLIGSYLIDIIMNYNVSCDGNIKIIAVDKNKDRSKERFELYYENKNFTIFIHDVNIYKEYKKADYIICAASNTSPTDYAKYPVDTINTNIFGCYNLLEFCKNNEVEKFLFCSSVEVYGLNKDGIEVFDETYSGYVDCNSSRSCYPTAKRLCETMCSSYSEQYNINYSIARIGRIYGPTVIKEDNKATTQFINNGLKEENIILKSLGMQKYSYCYVGDCCIALLYLLLQGKNKEAYNVADDNSICYLKDFAETISKKCNTKVEFQIDESLNSKGYSKVSNAILDTNKISDLGWKPKYDLAKGIDTTIEILKGMNNEKI